ncbi:non-hydrolyzing UDP-N-acetylglucosamine 2-epimerase [Pontibacter anaerobius]|uniref:UDP-N-acetylglucosamine 2-epimerase (Non-hydrolyzing) n=1 Tax=Pontibacter anaerobius TaxID=2993940 RepID=A0ABT3REJ2_9BACT|nr:UDP-N-acetylglucosamine 2-epimerase (non-hydrolyzing) [Pontibacter anaerobius]MCX2739936.1 UDP-N-acetylglucosamine 2-epimerase (non-hydrolyzing) [Pontibacter anaerobius]
MLISIVAGARPNFMKIAPIIDAIEEEEGISYRLIHTGQHYDKKMSGDFFEQLGIPEPHVNLEAGGGTQAEQTAAIMLKFEKELLANPSELVVVVGDVTSTMACAITAQKLCIPVAHVEGGIRSGDWSMPEEINRMVTDSITNYFFTTSEVANANLRRSGVTDDRIFFVGNTMIDTLLKQMPKLSKPYFWEELGLEKKQYLVLTLHRPSNVDDASQLKGLLKVLEDSEIQVPVVFPVHPRTCKNLEVFDIQLHNVKTVEPMSYLEFNYLVQNAMGVITDSGGITEETTVMGIPCMTLRDSTERPETCTLGTNVLLGSNPAALREALAKLQAGEWKKGTIPPLWDGKTAERIVGHISDIFKVEREKARLVF